MKKLQKICQGIGFMMLLAMAGLEAEVIYLLLWAAVSVILLYFGKSFSFQQQP